MSSSTCLLAKYFLPLAIVATAAFAFMAPPLNAQVINAGGANAVLPDDGVVPASYQGSGSFYNSQLGTAFRLSYHTESYGVGDDVVSLGGMKVIDQGNASWFIDAQGTMSNDFGGGFNFGFGHRAIADMGFGPDPERINGLGFWVDGQSTDADNFFTQLGFNLESLGDSFDMRFNGHFPLERTMSGDPITTSADDLTFVGNNLFAGSERFVVDTAHDVVDVEFAKRIMDLDAWAFAGGYHLGGGGLDTEGVRVGLRGYAVPDLALSLQVTDDDTFNTNVVFGLTWFVGRTHKGNLPCGTLADRMREPVIRNDYIATTSRSVAGSAGLALTDTETGSALRIVHVDSTAGAGGDGTFENPFDRLDSAGGAGSAVDDKILVHGGSTFTDQTLILQAGQDLLGEGRDPNVTGTPVAITHSVNTVERGLITLPETAVGASLALTPTITGGALDDIFTMADNSTVNNFIVNGGARAVVADGVTAPSGSMLANLDLNNQTGDAVSLTNISGTAIVENTVLIEGAGGAGLLVDGGLDGMTLNAGITNSAGSALTIRSRTGGTLNYGGTIDDDGGDGITIDGNTDSTITLSNASTDVTNGIDINTTAEAVAVTSNTDSTINFTGTLGVTGTGANRAVNIAGNNVGTTVGITDLDATALNGNTVEINGGGTVTIGSVDDTRTIANTGTGNAFDNTGALLADDNATITINSNIENSGSGRAVRVVSRTANNVAITGTVDETGDGILIQGNSGGFITLNGQTTANVTGGNTAIDINSNTDDVSIGFIGVDITTDSGIGFRAVDGGDLSVAGTANSITTTSGVALDLRDMNVIAANVTFDTIDVTAGTGNGVNLQDLEGGGQVVLGSGTNDGDGGTIVAAGTAINVDNVDSLLVSNITINNTTGQGVNVTNQDAASAATFTGLNVTTTTGDGVTVDGNADGTITFNSLDATATGGGDAVVLSDNNAATVDINDLQATTTGGGFAFNASGSGIIDLSGDVDINATGSRGIRMDGVTIAPGGVTFETVNITGGNGIGVLLRNLDGGRVTVGTGTNPGDSGTLQAVNAAIEINNVEDVVVDGFTINNTAVAEGIRVVNQAAGSTASISGTDITTVNATALDISGNTGGTISFNNGDVEATGTGAGINLNTNAGASISINGVDVTTTSGQAFLATGGGTVTATGTNTINSTTGVGLTLDGVTVGAAGAAFNEVNVNGAANGIVLNNLTGGQVRVGAAGATGTDGAGGTLTTTGTAIMVTDVSNAVFNDVTVTNAAGDSVVVDHTSTNDATVVFDNLSLTSTTGGRGVVLTDNGTGELDFTLQNSTVNTTATDTIAFELITGDNTGEVDVRFISNTIATGNESALAANLTLGTGDVQFLMTGNSVTNDSAASAAALFDVTAARTLNATIGDETGSAPFDSNSFTNANAAGTALDARLNNAAGRLNLDLRDNSATGGAVDYLLTETAGDFGVVDRTETITNNNNNAGTVTLGGGGVEADFDDLAPPIKRVD